MGPARAGLQHPDQRQRLLGGRGRATLTENASFGLETYAKEELVAELGAAFLSNAVGLDLALTEPSTAGYLANWLQTLRNDKYLIISVAN